MRRLAIGREEEVCAVRAGVAADCDDGRLEIYCLVRVVRPGNVLGCVGGHDGTLAAAAAAAAVDGGGDAEEDREKHGDEENEEGDEVFCMQFLGHVLVWCNMCMCLGRWFSFLFFFFLVSINDSLCNSGCDGRLSHVTACRGTLQIRKCCMAERSKTPEAA